MDILHLLVDKFGKDLSPGRMFESVVLLSIIWSKLKPHLTKIEVRLLGVETAVKDGFQTRDVRFEKIENRITILEKNNLGKVKI